MRGSDRSGCVESQQDVEGGGIYSASAGGITIVCSVAVCFS